MNLLNVSYDLMTPGQNYPAVVERLKALGATRIMRSEWMLKSNMSASALRDDLLRYMDSNDRLLVVDVSNAPMAWHNLEVQLKSAFNLT